MSNKQISIVALAAGLVALLGFVAFKNSGSSALSSPVDVSASPDTPSSSPTAQAALDPRTDGSDLDGVTPIPPSEGGGSRASASDELTYAPTEGRWIVGRVLFPDGAQTGEELEVFALESELGYASFLQRTWAREEGDTDAPGVQSSATVDDDGRFRIAAAEGKDAHLMLRGRYLYLPSTVPVPSDADADVELAPIAGACITLESKTPDGSPLGETKFKLDTSTDDEPFNPLAPSGGMGLRVALRGPLPGGPVELRALPVDAKYKLLVLPEEWAAQRRTIEDLVARETQRVELTLQVGGRVSGVVTDQLGSPVQGAEISASLPGQTFGFGDQEVRTAESAADGSFSLEAVCAVPVNLRATHDAHLDSKKVRVEPGDGEHTQGIALELEDGKTVTGRVLLPDGGPAAGVEVRASFDPAFLAGPSAFNALRGASGRAETNSDGSYTIAGLGGGPFVLQCETEGTAGADLTARRDNVAAGSENVDLRLHPPIGLWGRVADSDGRPLSSFKIQATRQVESSMGNLGLDTQSTSVSDAENGAFFMENLIEGSWEVSAIAEGFRSLEPVEIVLPADTENDPLAITVIATATFSGMVFAPDGKPVGDATIEVDTGQPNWMSQLTQSQSAPRATSNEDGSFLLEGVPPGAVALYASAENFARGESVSLEVAPGERVDDVELRLILGGRLTGEVYRDNGELASGMMVMANSMTMNQSMATTDAQGFFEISGLTPGSYQVIAMDRGADMSGMDDGNMSGIMKSMKMGQADITDGQDTHIVIGAPPANPVRVHGRVTHGGEPFTGAIITFYPSGEKLYEHLKFTDLDGQGEYEIVLDGPGEYVAIVQRIGGAPGQQQNIEYSEEIPEDTDHRLNFELPLGRISGVVLGPDRQPRSGARITLSPSGGIRSDALLGGQYAEIQTGADGSYDLPALRPGSYTVSAGGAAMFNAGGAANLGRESIDVKVRENQWVEDVNFSLDAPGSIEVSVTDSAGAPVGGAYIFVRNSEGQIMEPFSLAQTDGTGRFEQHGLAPGEYTVTSRKGELVSLESTPVTVRAASRTKHASRIEDGSILWIRIRDKEGPKRASIRVVDSSGREWGGMFGMEDLQVLYLDGGFSPTEHRIGPLPPGKYRVYAESDGLSATKPVTLRASEERKLTVRLK